MLQQFFRVLLVVLLIPTTSKKREKRTHTDGKMQRDLEVKEIQKTNLTDTYEEFIFMSHGSDLFILKTNTSQQVKCVIEIFWKQTNTFAAAEVFEGEEVGIQIKSANNIENKLFYTGTGFQFYAERQSRYEIKFTSKGQKSKLINFRLSKLFEIDQLASQESNDQPYKLLEGLLNDLHSSLSLVDRNKMFLNKAHLEVKQQSEIYLKYQFGEALVIIISTVLEIALMHRMLNKQYLV